MDFVHSVRPAAEHLQPAVRNYCNREWTNHPGWVSEFGEHGMGGAMADGADLSGARIGAEVFAGRHVGATDGYPRRAGSVCGKERFICARSCVAPVSARQA